jgi:ribosome-associated protein
MDRIVSIHSRLSIPFSELRFRFARSGGPGGQHVNKTATKVELVFNLDRSSALTDRQRQRLRAALGNRISSDGTLRIEVQETRSQKRNRDLAVERFRTLLARALQNRKKRIPTNPSVRARAKRLREKKRRGEIKRMRQDPSD